MPRDGRSRRLSFKRLASLCLTGWAWGAVSAQAPMSVRPWHKSLPMGFRQVIEDDGNTVVLTPPDTEPYVVRLTYHSLQAYVKERPKVGREFIAHLAAKKGLPTFAIEANGGIAFTEAPVSSVQEGVRVQETAGGMGVDAAYVLFSVVIDEAAVAEPAMKELLGPGLRSLLGKLR